MSVRLITLTTDFGWGSYYVAQMKGAIFLRNPSASVIDLSHELPPHDVRSAAYWIHRATRMFPADTIHVVVVDPGVGTRRDLVYCRTKSRVFLAPDNGVLSRVVAADGIEQIVRLSNTQLFHADVSQTFHGRDILAPVSAKLSLGASPLILGEPLDQLQSFRWNEPEIAAERIVGEVVYVDRFGNLISNISRGQLEQAAGSAMASIRVRIADRQIEGLSGTYGERSPHSLLAIFDSDGFLEVAVVNSSAAETLALGVGAAMRVEWNRPT